MRGLLRGSTTAFAPHAKPVTSTFITACCGIQTAWTPATLTSPCSLSLWSCADEAPALPFTFSSSAHFGIFASTFVPRTLGLLLCWTMAALSLRTSAPHFGTVTPSTCRSSCRYLRCGFLYTYMHACMHACVHTYIHACMHACMHTYIFI